MRDPERERVVLNTLRRANTGPSTAAQLQNSFGHHGESRRIRRWCPPLKGKRNGSSGT